MPTPLELVVELGMKLYPLKPNLFPMSKVADTCFELLSLMSERNIISSFSLVTLKIFLEVFLHSEEIFND